jgi:hypothetical protein
MERWGELGKIIGGYSPVKRPQFKNTHFIK